MITKPASATADGKTMSADSGAEPRGSKIRVRRRRSSASRARIFSSIVVPGTSSTPPTTTRLCSPSAWASTQWMTLAIRIRGTLPAHARRQGRGDHGGGIGDRARDRAPLRGRRGARDRRRSGLRARPRDVRRACQRDPGARRRHQARGRRGDARAARPPRRLLQQRGHPRAGQAARPDQPRRVGPGARRQPDRAVRRRAGGRAEAARRVAARHGLDHRQPPAPGPRRLCRLQGRGDRAGEGARGRARPRRARERDQPRPGQHADAGRLRVRRRRCAGPAAQAADRARGHRRSRRLSGLRRGQGDHRRGLQHRRGPRPVSSFMAIDPSTGHEFAELPLTGAEQVAAMVQDARRALAVEHDWRVPQTRAQALQRLARRVEAEAEGLADMETPDSGKPLTQARADAAATVRYLDYYAGSIERLEGRTIPLGPQVLDYTVREPWGVCGQVIPWNYPLQIAARCAAPALAAGNAVIVKPSELASLTPLRLAEFAEDAGVPRGMIQVATGGGATGAALVEHADHVTFVGSAATGAQVAAVCARRLAPLELELGGKSPNVVFADADLDKATPAIVRALLQNAGQSCSAGSRLLVQRAIYDELIERVTRAFEAVSIGPGIEDRDLGPLISERQLARALGMLDTARAAGA